jgi:hypothetical protein
MASGPGIHSAAAHPVGLPEPNLFPIHRKYDFKDRVEVCSLVILQYDTFDH